MLTVGFFPDDRHIIKGMENSIRWRVCHGATPAICARTRKIAFALSSKYTTPMDGCESVKGLKAELVALHGLFM